MEFIKGLFGIGNEAQVKKLQKIADQIEAAAGPLRNLRDADLRGKTDEFRKRLAKGETLDDLLPEAFAVVGEAAKRTVGQTPFRTQYICGIVLHQGRISEMKTGEGKTLSAAMPAYLNALTGKGVHIVTVNEYLASFQGEWMGKIYRFLGMEVGILLHDLEPRERQVVYGADITYGTNNEYGFDYLRDNMVVYKDNMVQRELHYAIVDEVDSILIDEARTPLIISGQGDKSTELYERADAFARRLTQGEDYEIDEKLRSVTLLEGGVKRAEQFFGLDNLSDIENTGINHHINQALKANTIFKRDVDYVVKEGQVIIVDEFTGRLMTGRRYSEGLHQAIEAKEHVKVERESRTLATITFQNFYRMYSKLAGMTGTAKTEEGEFEGIYKLDVVQVPTNRPMIREDLDDQIYRTEAGKYTAVVEEVARLHEIGRPVLVGTTSVEKSELISSMLRHKGVPHDVLNAKYHEKEAEIIAQAGKVGAVTIATNMAGRGTDILLGGNPEYLAREQMEKEGYPAQVIDEAQGFNENVSEESLAARKVYRKLLAAYKKEIDVAHEEVVAVGGLHIMGTERHESRRVDNQLRGRAGRQGDPGSSRFYISLEDDLMRRFGGDRIAPLIDRLGMDETTPLENSLLSKQIESAQKRVEGHNYDIRKHVLQYDDVMNKQREVIYAQRRQVLNGESVHGEIMKMLEDFVERMVGAHCSADIIPEEWDLALLTAEFAPFFSLAPLGLGEITAKAYINMTPESLTADILALGKQKYEERAAAAREAGAATFEEIERVLLLRAVDNHWMNQIDDMDQLRHGIGLRAIAQRDPVVEYKIEGFAMFEAMIQAIQEDALKMLFHVAVEKPVERKQVATPTTASHGDAEPAAKKPQTRDTDKVGRNAPCPCGSGKKYKNCHGA